PEIGFELDLTAEFKLQPLGNGERNTAFRANIRGRRYEYTQSKQDVLSPPGFRVNHRVAPMVALFSGLRARPISERTAPAAQNRRRVPATGGANGPRRTSRGRRNRADKRGLTERTDISRGAGRLAGGPQ